MVRKLQTKLRQGETDIMQPIVFQRYHVRNSPNWRAEAQKIPWERPGRGGIMKIVDVRKHQPEKRQRIIERLAAQSPDLTSVRVLVVEDHPDTRELFCTLLRTSGAVVIGVDSAEKAMEALVSFKPDVLVADIGLPGVDGYGLIRQIRALPPEKGGNIPAMAVTAYGMPDDRARALWKGFQMHVPKPIDPQDLLYRVARLVSPHRKSKVA